MKKSWKHAFICPNSKICKYMQNKIWTINKTKQILPESTFLYGVTKNKKDANALNSQPF